METVLHGRAVKEFLKTRLRARIGVLAQVLTRRDRRLAVIPLFSTIRGQGFTEYGTRLSDSW